MLEDRAVIFFNHTLTVVLIFGGGARPITRNRRREKSVRICACEDAARLDGVKSMRILMLATASVIVLGMTGAGIGHAAELYSSPTNPPGSAPRAMTASEILLTAAQQQLKYSGLYNGSVDGKMG